jgi:GNAT superfamily N-acetyltransferase
VARVVALVHLDEEHVWYVLELSRVKRLPLADGYELRQAEDADLEQASTLTTMGRDEMATRRNRGARLWLVLHEGEPAFACWIFPRVTPVRAAMDRVLELPRGVACLEDSFTGASHRGQGIAGAAWTSVARELKNEGFTTLITKVEVDNVPSRKAVEKAGFRGASTMRLRRRGRRERVTFEEEVVDLTPAEAAVAIQLEEKLARG